jgi:hypothetical protein
MVPPNLFLSIPAHLLPSARFLSFVAGAQLCGAHAQPPPSCFCSPQADQPVPSSARAFHSRHHTILVGPWQPALPRSKRAMWRATAARGVGSHGGRLGTARHVACSTTSQTVLKPVGRGRRPNASVGIRAGYLPRPKSLPATRSLPDVNPCAAKSSCGLRCPIFGFF